MSNYLAVATVTAALRKLIQEAVNATSINATVTTQRPEAATDNGISPGRVNIYLYQVLPNRHLSNNDLPTRRADGTLVERPQLALNLHYLLSFYGNESEFEPERLYGKTVSVLHAYPQLTREMVRSTTGEYHSLRDADLADQVELVKFTPLALNLEEFSKLWSVFFQTTYTLSVAYEAAVILISGDELPELAKPVQTPTLYSDPTVGQTVQAAPPNTLTGLQLWLRPDGGITHDRQGAVITWSDQSGQEHHAGQSAAAARPTFVRNVINRQGAIRFAERGQFLRIDKLHYRNQGRISGITVVALVRSTAPTAQIILSFDAGANWQLALRNAAGGVSWQTVGADGVSHELVTPQTYTDGAWHLITAWFSAGADPDKQLFVDGVRVQSAQAHNGAALGTGATRFGAVGIDAQAEQVDGTVGATAFLKGDLAEIVILDRALLDPERQQLEQYFIEKYVNRH